MLIRRDLHSSDRILQIGVAIGVGLLLGIACIWLPALWIVGLVIGIGLVFATIKRPEIGLLTILIATSSVIFEDQLPQFSMGGISLHIPDFLLLGMLGFIAVRWLVDARFKILRTPLDWPLLIFYGVTLVSTLIAIYHSSVNVETARRLIRVMTYYMTFFVVTNLVRERRQLSFLLNGLFLLATVVAAVMVAQYVLGRSVILLPGRVEALNTQAVAYGDVTRILPPGISIVLISFFTTFCILVLEKFKPIGWLKLLQFGLLGMGLLFSFLRSYWGVLLMVFSLLVLILKGHEWQKLINLGMAFIFSAAMILTFTTIIQGSRVAVLLGAASDRLNTIFNAGTYQGQDSSVVWRAIEDGYALRQISAHPLLGSGLGSLYRPFDPRLDKGGADLRGFIHNGHFWILLDSGLMGYLAIMALSIIFLVRGLRYWRSIVNAQLRGVVLGFTLVYLAILVAAGVNSIFTDWYWTPVIGILMGINEVILLRFRLEE
jgi:hypothetical protein